MADPSDIFMSGKKIQKCTGIIHMTLHTQWQGFQPLQNVKGISWRQAGSKIIHRFCPKLCGKCCRAKFFMKIYPIH